ncbi:MAG: NuoI/complex I 23 kDa subunit family protein [Planctomycetota bacterium JB042]
MVLVKQRKLSLGERFYFKTVLVGLVYTVKNIFKKKITRQYPEVKLDPAPSFHGVPVLVQDTEGNPKCVACGLCEFVCPPIAIHIVGTETDRPIERAPKTFQIDMLRCIECGYCEEVCPEEAIVMSQEYELVGGNRHDFKWELDQLLTPESKLKPRLEYIRKTFHRWRVDAREEGTAAAVPGKGGAGKPLQGTKVHAALERYGDNY